MEDIYSICRFLIGLGRFGEVKRIIINAGRSLEELGIPNLNKGYARLRIEFYDKLGKQEDKIRALEDFYKASLEQEKESIANYKYFLNIRNRLSSMEKENVMLQKQAETNKLWDYMYAADNALYDVKEHKKGEVVLLHEARISQKSLDKAQHS